jgi:hypothetical protein
MLGNYRVAAQLVASRVVLSSTELVSSMPPHRILPTGRGHIFRDNSQSKQRSFNVSCYTATGRQNHDQLQMQANCQCYHNTQQASR